MFTFHAALATGAFVLASSISALAAQTAPGGMTIADIGHDSAAYVGGKSSDAKIIDGAVPERSPYDSIVDASGSVVVEIALSADGKLLQSSVVRSSGRHSLDASALNAVRASRFAPAVVSGTPVAGRYAVNVVFDPNP